MDGDGDGVADGCDQCPGSDDAVDTDADGVADGCDVCPGGDDRSDADGDGLPDHCDAADAPAPDGDEPDGCGCSATSGHGGPWGGLALLVLWRRMRE